MDPHPYGIWSVIPPLVAIGLAISTRRVVLSLAAGVLFGCMILADGNPLVAIPDMLEIRLWKSLADSEHLRVFAFTMLMGSMVGVISRSGGMHGVVDSLSRFANTRRSGQLTTWGLGLIVFFDDYANSLLLGSTMRPFADRLKISREKLAYLVDSTAAPVSGLALVSTWVAGEIGFIGKGLAGLEFTGDVSLFRLFVETIPYRFYVLLSLVFVMLVGLMRRDFGPMLAAEQRCVRGGADSHASSSDKEHQMLTPTEGSPRRWTDAILPVMVVIGVTVALLFVTGRYDDGKLRDSAWEIIGNGDSYVSLLYGSIFGLLTAVLLSRRGGNLSLAEIRKTAWQGALLMVPALVVLWLSWSLADVTGRVEDAADPIRLQTGDYLARQLEGVSVALMPTIIFVVAGAVAFATGTSWGTMGILMPPAIGATYALLSAGQGGSPISAADPIFLGSIGSVLAGAIFGDHCSPISDTTVLSSQASGCDLMAHVWTQMPYALLVGGVSIVCGTLPIGFGISVWPLLPLGVCVLAGCLFWFGRCAED